MRLCVRPEKRDAGVYEVGQGQEEILMVEGGDEPKEEEGEEEEAEDEKEPGKISSAVTVFRFIMKQSYICALIAMMVSGLVLGPIHGQTVVLSDSEHGALQT